MRYVIPDHPSPFRLCPRDCSGSEAGRGVRARALLFMWSAGVFLFGPPRPARAIPPELVRAVPSDVSVAYYWEGSQAGGGDSEPNQGVAAFAASMIDGALRVGGLSMIDPALRPWIDGVAATMTVAPYPFALLLFDVNTVREDDNSHKLGDTRAALVILSRGDNENIERRIRHLLASYTNQSESTLTTGDAAGRTRFLLRDQRLPDWALFEWGAVGDYYVLAVGAESFERVFGAIAGHEENLFTDTWFHEAGDLLSLTRSAIALYLCPGAIVRDPDVDMRRKLVRVQQALRLLGIRRTLATVRREERVVTIQSANERSGANELHTLAGGPLMAKVPKGLIPEQATRCTAVDWDPRALLRAIQNGVLSSRSPHNQRDLRAFWNNVEQQSGVSIEMDIFAQLGEPLIIHNAPRHVLNLPLAWTYVIPIRGDPGSLRLSLDRLLEYARDSIDGDALVQLRRDPDGIWFLFSGVSGPALGITDAGVIISFSPAATRENINRFKEAPHESP